MACAVRSLGLMLIVARRPMAAVAAVDVEKAATGPRARAALDSFCVRAFRTNEHVPKVQQLSVHERWIDKIRTGPSP